MSDANDDVKFSLKVMMNNQKTKVVFAEVDSTFTDVLFSFLTLPLGRIVRILKNHYGDEAAPAFGSLTTLYNGLANLDSVHFWTEAAKSILLHPRSSSDHHCNRLMLDVSDSPPVEYFVCEMFTSRFESISMFYDNIGQCRCCGSDRIKKEAAEKDKESSDGVFMMGRGSFLITDNLQIVSSTGLSEIFRVLRTSDIKNGELTTVSFGFAEVMDLLKASLISSTPLSDVILKKTGQMNSPTKQHGGVTGNNASTSNSKKMNLKVMVHKSTNKLLYAEAKEDFVEFLFGLLVIPLGAVECLFSSRSSIKAIENLYRSIADRIDDKYFKNHDAKERLIKPKIPHGYVSENYFLPLSQQSLPQAYKESFWKPSLSFPKGQGNYISGPQTYKVEDDLTVTPFCFASIISYLNEQKIAISDVEELQLEIGLEEGLGILKASLTSTSALTDALFSHTANKRPKQEQA